MVFKLELRPDYLVFNHRPSDLRNYQKCLSWGIPFEKILTIKNKQMRKIYFALFIASVVLTTYACKYNKAETAQIAERWTVEKANQWGTNQTWMAGANFLPSTAINQLEMWQAESFDKETIDRELGFAESIGMKVMRVYLHHLAWEVDSVGFKKRMDEYLTIASKHNILTVFVFFDDCWNPTYTSGKQPDPKPGVHNSGWVRDPGDLIFTKPEIVGVLESYVKDILTTFANDKRIFIWDLYNEPGNSAYENKSMPLLKNVFQWGREVYPSQPLSSGVWNKNLGDLNKFQVENSDVITYHNYNDEKEHQACIDSLRIYKRPMICTEYMARRNNSLFSNILPLLKGENIVAINWGLVSGKSNTIYAWDTPMADGSEPELWFHDIFRKDGTYYKEEEVKIIKQLTGKE